MGGLDLFSGLIGAILGSILSNNVVKMNELDSKSGWRKKLFELSSKDIMTLDDVYLLRTTLRYKKKESMTMFDFSYMSDEIIDFCELIVKIYGNNKRDEDNKIIYIENNNIRECIRIYCRYLLKNHWEVFSTNWFFFNKSFQLPNDLKLGYETQVLIAKEMKIYMDNNGLNNRDNSADTTEDEAYKNFEEFKKNVTNFIEVGENFVLKEDTKGALDWKFYISLGVSLFIILLFIYQKSFYTIDFLDRQCLSVVLIVILSISSVFSYCEYKNSKRISVEIITNPNDESN